MGTLGHFLGELELRLLRRRIEDVLLFNFMDHILIDVAEIFIRDVAVIVLVLLLLAEVWLLPKTKCEGCPQRRVLLVVHGLGDLVGGVS